MSDEIKETSPSEDVLNEKLEQKQETIQPEVVEETKETPTIEEEKVEDEKKVEANEEQTPQDEHREVLPEGKGDVDKVSEETKDTEPKEEVVHSNDGTPVEEIEEKPEVVEEQVDIDAIKRELEDLKAERQEAIEVDALNKESAKVAREYDEFCSTIGNALENRFKELNIPLDKTIEDLKKEDATKAVVAEGLIREANDLIERGKRDANNFLMNKTRDLVFKKADRLLKRFDVTDEEAEVVADTFLEIMNQSGIRDLGDDLLAKLELAVARAKMVCGTVSKTAKKVSEKAEQVKEVIEKVEEVISDKKDIKPEEKVPEKEEVEKEKVEDVQGPGKKGEVITPKVTEEKPDLSEFEEGTGNQSGPVTERITVDNVLEKMLALPFKQQPAFYKEHYALLEEAQRKIRRGI